jgi:hypothetical protein
MLTLLFKSISNMVNIFPSVLARSWECCPRCCPDSLPSPSLRHHCFWLLQDLAGPQCCCSPAARSRRFSHQCLGTGALPASPVSRPQDHCRCGLESLSLHSNVFFETLPRSDNCVQNFTFFGLALHGTERKRKRIREENGNYY